MWENEICKENPKLSHDYLKERLKIMTESFIIA